jgi:AbrB family looped-hinge helix DNA binding protein
LATAKPEFEHVGTAPISGQGQVTIPKPARDACGLGEGDRVLVFVERKMGQILLTHEPLADEMIALAAKAAQKKRSTRE